MPVILHEADARTSKAHWLRLAKNCMVSPELIEPVAEYCTRNPGSSLWHASWVIQGERGKCSCTPCTLARGEKLSCL